jgi:hypothetical protein
MAKEFGAAGEYEPMWPARNVVARRFLQIYRANQDSTVKSR